MPPKESKVYDPDIEKNKAIACLSYVWGLCLIPLLLKRSSKFAQFHARQGFVLFIADLVVALVMWIPVIGLAALVVVIIISIIGCIKAYNGEWWEAPFMYRWSQKIKF